MKIALYIEDGLEQVILTPETDVEKGIVRKLEDGTRRLEVKRGQFYECRGGWVRQGMVSNETTGASSESTMLILRPIADTNG